MPFVSTLTADIAQKKPGDPIRSADWNQLGAEVLGVGQEVSSLQQGVADLNNLMGVQVSGLRQEVTALLRRVDSTTAELAKGRFTGAVQGDLRVSGALAVDGATTLRNGLELAGGALSFGNRTGQFINAWGTNFGLGIQGGTLYCRSESVFAWHKGGAHSDGLADPGGGVALMTLNQDGLGLAGGLGTGGALSFGARLGQHINLWNRDYGIGIQPSLMYFRSGVDAGFAWYSGGEHQDSRSPGSGTAMMSLSGWSLHVRGSVMGTVSVQLSDERLKQNITPIAPDQSLLRLMDLTVYEYEYRPEFQPAAAGQRHHGFLAQEVEKIIPAAVTITDDVTLDNGEVIHGTRGVAYNSIFTEAVGAIQALHQRLQAQEARIQQLVAQLAAAGVA